MGYRNIFMNMCLTKNNVFYPLPASSTNVKSDEYTLIDNISHTSVRVKYTSILFILFNQDLDITIYSLTPHWTLIRPQYYHGWPQHAQMNMKYSEPQKDWVRWWDGQTTNKQTEQSVVCTVWDGKSSEILTHFSQLSSQSSLMSLVSISLSKIGSN